MWSLFELTCVGVGVVMPFPVVCVEVGALVIVPVDEGGGGSPSY